METVKYSGESLDIYWSLLKHLSVEAKLELVSRLVDSVKKPEKKPEKVETKSEILDRLYGAWANDGESAEDKIARLGARPTSYSS